MAEQSPPQLLQIYRDFLNRGSEAAFKRIEEDAARICADLHCPNAHLAMESLGTPTEVWWLTPYASEAEQQRVANAYANNPALTAALDGISRRKAAVVGTPVDVVAKYRADLSRRRWKLAGARFFVVTTTRRDPQIEGAVFEAADSTRFIFRAFGTRKEAEIIAAESDPDTMVFAVRPYWGMPAREWVEADPAF